MYSASEKLAIIRLVEDSELSIRRTLVEINVSPQQFLPAGTGCMSVMALKVYRTTTGQHASTGIEYLTRYESWWLRLPWINRS